MSKKLPLTLACGDYEITRPLKLGQVEPEGIDLTVLDIGSRERHWRMARGNEFDICEFNICAYFMAKDRGVPWTSLPVFLHRRFRHGFVFVNTTKKIKTPKDLIGARVGGTNFTPAGNMWIRGILEEDYGVPHRKIVWVTERDEDVDFKPPKGLQIERVDAGTLDERLVSGALDAMISPSFPKSFLKGDKRVDRLFRDNKAVEIEYFRKTGIFPIMHVTAIKQDVLDKYPWVANNMVAAFDKAKAIAYRKTQNPRTAPIAWVRNALEEQEAVLGPDPWEYGLGPRNRKNLETALKYTFQQGLIRRRPKLDELFVNTDLPIGDSESF